jgi:hypothetical protein
VIEFATMNAYARHPGTLRFRLDQVHPLLALTVLLPLVAWLVFSRRAQGWWLEGLGGGVTMAIGTAACMLVVHGLSMATAKMMGQQARHCYGDLTLAMVLVGCWPPAASGCAYISEIYRQAAIWYDAPLWSFERPLFRALWASPLMSLPVTMWQTIYTTMWFFVIFTLCLLVHAKRDRDAIAMAVAVPGMFYAAQLVALVVPVAGPALFAPDAFGYIHGSLISSAQSVLLAYKEGKVAQNGVMYALVSLPSLHVGLTWLACSYLVPLHRLFWPIAGVMLVSIWLSTLVLGWHYAVDGVAGIALAIVAKWIADWAMRIAPMMTYRPIKTLSP